MCINVRLCGVLIQRYGVHDRAEYPLAPVETHTLRNKHTHNTSVATGSLEGKKAKVERRDNKKARKVVREQDMWDEKEVVQRQRKDTERVRDRTNLNVKSVHKYNCFSPNINDISLSVIILPSYCCTLCLCF